MTDDIFMLNCQNCKFLYFNSTICQNYLTAVKYIYNISICVLRPVKYFRFKSATTNAACLSATNYLCYYRLLCRLLFVYICLSQYSRGLHSICADTRAKTVVYFQYYFSLYSKNCLEINSYKFRTAELVILALLTV